jgi:hypothetical protein
VSKINGIVAEIATSAEQQATGLQQVNIAISQMDETTQKNASMVEESNAASHSLSQETSQLASLVEQFQVEGRDGAALRRELRKVAPHVFAKARRPSRPSLTPVAVVRPRTGRSQARARFAASQDGGRRWRRSCRQGRVDRVLKPRRVATSVAGETTRAASSAAR